MSPFAGLLLAGLTLIARADYETCSDKNNYLESTLTAQRACATGNSCDQTNAAAPAVAGNLSSVNTELTLPPACVLDSLQRAPARGTRYGICSGTGPVLHAAKVPRPCLSERYHLTVYSDYVQAMSCVGLDPREMFGMINLESNFEVNIGSPTGAWGGGQLTSVAIAEVNVQKRLAPLVERKECSTLKDILGRPMAPRNVCDRIAPPDNPARNFLYAAETYLLAKEAAAKLMNRRAAFAGLSADSRARVLFDLTAYSYNGGEGGVAQALSVFLSENPGRVRSYRAFHDAFRKFLLESFGESIPYYASNPDVLQKKRVEISSYVQLIDARLARTEKSVGAKCSL